MKAIAEGPGLVTSEHLLGQRQLFGHPEEKRCGLETLGRLWGVAIDDPYHHVTIQMDVDADLDRLEFCRLSDARLRLRFRLLFVSFAFVSIIHGCQVIVHLPAPDNPMLSFRFK